VLEQHKPLMLSLSTFLRPPKRASRRREHEASEVTGHSMDSLS